MAAVADLVVFAGQDCVVNLLAVALPMNSKIEKKIISQLQAIGSFFTAQLQDRRL